MTKGFIVIGYEPKEENTVVDFIDYYYDPHIRLWTIQLRNSDGDQIGEAIYRYGKKDALKEVKDLEKKYGVKSGDYYKKEGLL